MRIEISIRHQTLTLFDNFGGVTPARPLREPDVGRPRGAPPEPDLQPGHRAAPAFHHFFGGLDVLPADGAGRGAAAGVWFGGND